jgi:hypothetical protein
MSVHIYQEFVYLTAKEKCIFALQVSFYIMYFEMSPEMW